MFKKLGMGLILTTAMLTACGKKEAKVEAPKVDMQPLKLVVVNGDKYSQVLQAQLKKAGIPVEITEKKDSSTLMADLAAGSFDIAVQGWTTVTGNPDYAVMSLFHSNGDYNRGGLKNAELDKALEEGRASAVGSPEYKKAYFEVERILNENAYIVPMTYVEKTLGYTKNLTGVDLWKSRSSKIEEMSWTPESGKDNEKDAAIGRHTSINLTSFDPAKANDGTVFPFNSAMYSRLVNLGLKDEIEPGLATAWHSVDQQNFYFVIKDAKFSNGDKITGEDIVFSLSRAADKTMKDNKVYTVQGNMEEIKVVKAEEVPAEIKSELEKNGAIGNQEVIHIKTFKPYGQIYNMLAHTSGGVVQKKSVEKAGEIYGAVTNIDTVVASGPYIIKGIDKQKNEITFERNETYEPKAKLKYVTYKVIPDISSSLLALQSGTIDFLATIPDDSREKVKNDPKLNLIAKPSNGFNYVLFNLGKGENKPTFNEDLRKAIYYAINPNEVLNIVLSGNGAIGASPLSPVVAGTPNETGYKRPDFSLEKSAEFLKKYNETLKK